MGKGLLDLIQVNANLEFGENHALGRFKEAIRKWKLGRKAPRDVFSGYYKTNKWGDDESRSGKGSNLAATEGVRALLPPLLSELNIQSMLDLPCGDYHWMRHVDLGIESYTGGDIVEDMIAENARQHARDGVAFQVIDLIEGPIPTHDLIFTRDCLVHLSSDHVKAAIRNIKASGSTWLLTTTFPDRGQNDEISTGQWRLIDLQKPPFDLPQPHKLIPEGNEHVRGQGKNKMLGLWRVSDLPDFDIPTQA